MNFIDKLEQKIGRFAIKNLMFYLIIFYLIGFILDQINPDFYYNYLSLNIEMIGRGEIWRLVTFLCAPPSYKFIMFLLLSFIYYSLGRSLELIWGTFRFNLYIFIGILGCILAELITYLIFGFDPMITADRLYLSMLLGMAATFPDMTFLFCFIIPIKAKWLGVLYGGLIIFEIVEGVILHYYVVVIELVLSLLNFIIFFFFIRKKNTNFAGKKVKVIKISKEKSKANTKIARHRCAVCGKTDLEYPDMTFRFCSKCNGAFEYCEEHLFTHEHAK